MGATCCGPDVNCRGLGIPVELGPTDSDSMWLKSMTFLIFEIFAFGIFTGNRQFGGNMWEPHLRRPLVVLEPAKPSVSCQCHM